MCWQLSSCLSISRGVFLALVRLIHGLKEEGKILSMNKALAILVTSGISYLYLYSWK